EAAKDAADDCPPSAPEILFRHDGVRDVAAAAAADENLGAWTSGAIEQDDRRVRVKASSEDCRRETGGAGADDRNVTFARARAQICSLRRATRSFDEGLRLADRDR